METTLATADSGPQRSPGGNRLQLINVLMVEIIELSRQRSLLLSTLQYTNDVTKSDYEGFYSLFLQVYDLVATTISPGLDKEIKDWQRAGLSSVNNKELRRRGVDLSLQLVNELRDLGLLQVFEEPVKPVFLFDFELEEYLESLEAQKSAPKEPVAVPPGAAVTPVEGTPPKRRRRNK